MVNNFPHLHSFRLSDEDERIYRSLLRRFEIHYKPNQTVAFRRLMRKVAAILNERQSLSEDHLHSPSDMRSQPDLEEENELCPYGMDPGEDQGDEPDYAEYRQEAAQRIIMRGNQPLTYETILAEVRAIKKEKGIN